MPVRPTIRRRPRGVNGAPAQAARIGRHSAIIRPVLRRKSPLAAIALLVAAMTLAGCASAPPELELRSLARDGRPSEILACPPGYCAARADIAVPDFPLAIGQLAAIVREAATALPRTTVVRDDPARHRFVAIQRTALLRFADTFWVELVERGPNSSSLAIYSRPNFGYYDFGVNRRRVDALLADIAERVGRAR